MGSDGLGEVYEGVRFDPAAAGKASHGLDTLADRLTADLQAAEQALAVPSAGADEVSRHAAQTANEVATSYLASAQAGVHEMRKLAAMLRMQSDEFDRAERETAANLGSTSGTSA